MSELIYACESECKKYQDPLVLMALGPTATVMAWKLQQKGIQAIDIGHLDICYEVSLRNNLGKMEFLYHVTILFLVSTQVRPFEGMKL